MWRKPIRLLIVVLLSLLALRPGFAEVVPDIDRFRLWTDCEPLSLNVYFQKKDDENDIDLTREAIEFAVRNRLQEARLYTDEPGFPHLFVSVDVVGLAFGIDIGLKKLVSDFYSKDAWFVATWSTGTTGIHGWEGNYILQFVSQYTDSFIDEYLRVNADSC